VQAGSQMKSAGNDMSAKAGQAKHDAKRSVQ